ncbi:unnamed protein product [Effrenium voratum]|uniref:Uncharacterized protein n=1 Tax=Effrenium voratum TaxID=2562239 RepID=A0AA36NEU6_9DINO|nr:unnamed protein product [Effrenium voratum]
MAALGDEDKALAQFWYSPGTLECLLAQCRRRDVNRIALLSAPSLYFALEAEVRKPAAGYPCARVFGEGREVVLFEFDQRWAEAKNFAYFDYREGAQGVDERWANHFDLVLADPPNLQMATLEQYADVINKLRAEKAKVLFVTCTHWGGFLLDRLGLFDVNFRPSMPSSALSQSGAFGLFANYKDPALCATNPEVEKDEDVSAECTGYYLGFPAQDL